MRAGRAAARAAAVVLLLAGLLATVAVAALQFVPLRPGPAPYAGGLSADRYGGRPERQVGFRELVAGADDPMSLTLWYPSRDDVDLPAAVSYPYRVKIFGPDRASTIGVATGEALRDARPDPAGGPYPLVVLSPGFGFGPMAYGWLAEHVASFGFVVVGLDHREQLDPSRLWEATINRPRDITRLLALMEQPAIPADIRNIVDVGTVAVIGHSYGGYAALAAGGARLNTAELASICDAIAKDDPIAFLCSELAPHENEMAALAGLSRPPDGLWPDWSDPRVTAVVAMAGDALPFGKSGLATLKVPVLAIGGTGDPDAPYEWGTHLVYEHAASPRKIEVGLVGGAHMLFTENSLQVRRVMNLFSTAFFNDRVWDKGQAHSITKHFVTAFLQSELKGDIDAGAALLPGAPVEGVTVLSSGY